MSSHKRKASRTIEALADVKANPATPKKGKDKPNPSPKSRHSRVLSDLKSPASYNRIGKGKENDEQASTPVQTSPTDKENHNAATPHLHKIAQVQTETVATSVQPATLSTIDEAAVKDAVIETHSSPTLCPSHLTPRLSNPIPRPTTPAAKTIDLISTSPARFADITAGTTTAATISNVATQIAVTQFTNADSGHSSVTISDRALSPPSSPELIRYRPTFGLLHPMSPRRSRELLKQRWEESEAGKKDMALKIAKKGKKGAKAKGKRAIKAEGKKAIQAKGKKGAGKAKGENADTIGAVEEQDGANGDQQVD